MKIIKAVFDDDKFEARITFEDATQFIINCPAAEKQADLKKRFRLPQNVAQFL